MKTKHVITLLILACTFTLLYTVYGQNEKKPATKSSVISFGQLPVPLYGQQTGMWCWATSTQMILAYYGITIYQCDLVNSHYHIPKDQSCCSDTTCQLPYTPKFKSTCVRGGPLLVNSTFGFTCDTAHTPLKWEVIRRQIDSVQSPIGFSINTPKGDSVTGKYVPAGGHVRVIKGYVEVNGNRYLIINDPMPVCQGSVYPITMYEYQHGRGNWLSTTAYYNFSKK